MQVFRFTAGTRIYPPLRYDLGPLEKHSPQATGQAQISLFEVALPYRVVQKTSKDDLITSSLSCPTSTELATAGSLDRKFGTVKGVAHDAN